MQFNADNKGHKEGYPLFFGAPLGVVDTINVQYPQLEKLYQEQLSQIWNEFEVDLSQDKMDMRETDKGTVDLMVKTIMWQTVADSVASRSIIETLGEYITNSELMNLATIWSFFEVIHARTYSHIIKQTFQVPNELLEELYGDAGVLQRSAIIVKSFDDLTALRGTTDEFEIRKAILKAFVALFALEAIAFMSSFAVTFGVIEGTHKFQGIGKLVQLICRDEVLHTRMDYNVLDIIVNDPLWAPALNDCKEDIAGILDEVVKQELKWADYLFSEGREVVGLNSELLKQYTIFMSQPVYEVLDIPFDYNAPKKTPLPYMDKFINGSRIQAAAQEIQISSYKIGAIADDTADLDLDFDF